MAGREVRVAVLGDASSLKRALREAEGAQQRYESDVARSTGRIAGLWGGVTATMSGFITNAVGSFVRDSWQAGIDVEQAWMRVQGVFGDTAKAIDDWSRGTAKAIGLSRVESLRATGTFGNLLTQLGFAQNEAGGMATNMTVAAASLAAFHGADPTQVIEAMSAAFRGEYDALQRYIPAISDAAIKQQAMQMTGKENADSLTLQEKAAAAYALMLQGLGPAQGVFTDGVETMAEKQMIANAQFEEAKTKLGEMLIPAGTWLMENFATFLAWWESDMQPNFERGIERIKGWWADWRASGAQSREDFIRGWNMVLDFFRDIGQAVHGVWSSITSTVQLGVNYVKEQIKSLFEMILGVIKRVQSIPGSAGRAALNFFGGLFGFDTGGVVPGPVGAPQLAVVHGGETVLPTHKQPASSFMGGGTQTIVVQVDGRELARAIVDRERAA